MADEYLTTEQVKSACSEFTAKTVMVVIGENVYAKEGGRWRCLDYKETECQS